MYCIFSKHFRKFSGNFRKDWSKFPEISGNFRTHNPIYSTSIESMNSSQQTYHYHLQTFFLFLTVHWAIQSSLRCSLFSCFLSTQNKRICYVMSTFSFFFQLCQMRTVRSMLTNETTVTLIHAFISSRLDYCNSLLYGISSTLLRRLQSIQNAAVRLVTGAKKFDHITPVLRKLHWLPIRQLVAYKLSLLESWCTSACTMLYQSTSAATVYRYHHYAGGIMTIRT